MTAHVHPPKRESFDIPARTNTDNKGIVRAVDEYVVHPWGLYMARPTPGRAQFHYLESWLLPSVGIRANVFHFNPGYEHEQDYYLDIGDITAGGTVWHTEDHYLDLVVYTSDRTELLDTDELLEAHHHGLVSTGTAESAIRKAVAAVEGLARHDHDLNGWLAAHGMHLSWR
jgi:predicted RNA-binding protein associated with RNAse of E/G family